MSGNAHGIEHGLVSFTTAIGARGKEAFRGFPNDHEVDALRARIGEGDADPWQHANRPEARVELETIPKVNLRDDLGAIGIADVRMSHGAEENGVR